MEDVLNVAVFGDLSDDEIEEAIMNNILNPRRAPQLRSVTYGRLDLDTLSDEEFTAYFRFKKRDIRRLCEALGIPPIIETEINCKTSGVEGLCILLRRLAYPNRYIDLERIFGLSATYMSVIAAKVIEIILHNKSFLIDNLNQIPWLNEDKLEYYSNAVATKGAALQKCWAFIDGTARPICRPTVNQEEYYSGHKRQHCVKYQSVLCPDGLIINLYGAVPGRSHDAGIFRESNLYEQLQNKMNTLVNGERYVIYGDSAYPIKPLLLRPYANRNLTPQQEEFNNSMKVVRQAVEWGFGKVVNEFAFLDFKKNQKIMLQDVQNMYKTAVILSNCHTCLYHGQTSQYFNIDPPELEEYLNIA